VTSARTNVETERPWSGLMGYSRAVRIGPLVEVAGTTSVSPQGEVLHPGDAYLQTREALSIITAALAELGAQPEDVIRTRVFVTDVNQWQDIARAHGEVFAEVCPASSMVEVARLLVPGLLVEIEATAYVNGT
jgi:enamine deaminase RidA (YjgF/YER057c/UK114 family)